jgi:hypothetical protein
LVRQPARERLLRRRDQRIAHGAHCRWQLD